MNTRINLNTQIVGLRIYGCIDGPSKMAQPPKKCAASTFCRLLSFLSWSRLRRVLLSHQNNLLFNLKQMGSSIKGLSVLSTLDTSENMLSHTWQTCKWAWQCRKVRNIFWDNNTRNLWDFFWAARIYCKSTNCLWHIFEFRFSMTQSLKYLFSQTLNSKYATNKFKALGLKLNLCTKVNDIGRVGVTKCTGILHLHFSREASNTIIYKQPRWEQCCAWSHQ